MFVWRLVRTCACRICAADKWCMGGQSAPSPECNIIDAALATGFSEPLEPVGRKHIAQVAFYLAGQSIR